MSKVLTRYVLIEKYPIFVIVKPHNLSGFWYGQCIGQSFKVCEFIDDVEFDNFDFSGVEEFEFYDFYKVIEKDEYQTDGVILKIHTII